jgi:hypothetical protein
MFVMHVAALAAPGAKRPEDGLVVGAAEPA